MFLASFVKYFLTLHHKVEFVVFGRTCWMEHRADCGGGVLGAGGGGHGAGGAVLEEEGCRSSRAIRRQQLQADRWRVLSSFSCYLSDMFARNIINKNTKTKPGVLWRYRCWRQRKTCWLSLLLIQRKIHKFWVLRVSKWPILD